MVQAEVKLGPASRTLPTEVGVYLFFGVPDVSRTDAGDLLSLRAQLMRVVRDGSGRMMYVASDFLWSPQNARGIWFTIDAQDVAEIARTEILDECVKRWVDDPSANFWTRASTVDRWNWRKSQGETKALAERAVDRAIELGYLVETEGGYLKRADPK